MAITHQIAYTESKRKKAAAPKGDALNSATTKPSTGDGVALTSIAHPRGARIRKRAADFGKGVTETLTAIVNDDKIVGIEKAIILRLDIALLTKIDAAKKARGLKARSETIRVLLGEALK